MNGNRHEVRLTLRPTPRILLAWRQFRHPHGSHVVAASRPRLDVWFHSLVPYRLRAAHRWYAHRHHRFWLPCPLCDVPFGGHEWRNVGGKPSSVPDPFHPPTSPDGPFMSVGICPPCTRAGRGFS